MSIDGESDPSLSPAGHPTKSTNLTPLSCYELLIPPLFWAKSKEKWNTTLKLNILTPIEIDEEPSLLLSYKLLGTKKGLNFGKQSTFCRTQAQFQRGIEQCVGRRAERDQSVEEEGYTSHQHCLVRHCWVDRNWWQWPKWSPEGTTCGHWHT